MRHDALAPGPLVVFKAGSSSSTPLCAEHGVKEGGPVLDGACEHGVYLQQIVGRDGGADVRSTGSVHPREKRFAAEAESALVTPD